MTRKLLTRLHISLPFLPVSMPSVPRSLTGCLPESLIHCCPLLQTSRVSQPSSPPARGHLCVCTEASQDQDGGTGLSTKMERQFRGISSHALRSWSIMSAGYCGCALRADNTAVTPSASTRPRACRVDGGLEKWIRSPREHKRIAARVGLAAERTARELKRAAIPRSRLDIGAALEPSR